MKIADFHAVQKLMPDLADVPPEQRRLWVNLFAQKSIERDDLRKRAAESNVGAVALPDQDNEMQSFPDAASSDRLGKRSLMVGFLRTALIQILDEDFDPNAITAAARLVTDEFRNRYGVEGTYALITDTIGTAQQTLEKTYRLGDLARATGFLLESVRSRVGAVESGNDRDEYSAPTERSYWARLKAERKRGPRNGPRLTADQVIEMTMRANGRVMSNEFSRHPKRSGLTVKEAVRNTLGLPMNEKVRLYDIVKPSLDSLPILAQQSTGNPDLNPLIKIKRGPNGITKFVTPDGAQFASYQAAETWLESIGS
jgi:hypothetical protein